MTFLSLVAMTFYWAYAFLANVMLSPSHCSTFSLMQIVQRPIFGSKAYKIGSIVRFHFPVQSFIFAAAVRLIHGIACNACYPNWIIAHISYVLPFFNDILYRCYSLLFFFPFVKLPKPIVYLHWTFSARVKWDRFHVTGKKNCNKKPNDSWFKRKKKFCATINRRLFPLPTIDRVIVIDKNDRKCWKKFISIQFMRYKRTCMHLQDETIILYWEPHARTHWHEHGHGQNHKPLPFDVVFDWRQLISFLRN